MKESSENNIRPSLSKRQILALQRMAQARQRLLDVIADLDVEEICQGEVVGDWTIKDIFGHLAAWNEEFRIEIDMILRGLHPGYERRISGENDFAEWNQRWIDIKRQYTWQRILLDFEQDIQQAMDLIQNLQPADFRKRGVTPWKKAAKERPENLATLDTDTVETLINFHWRHMNQHAKMIETWIAKPKKGEPSS
jgi:uncharacterized damage-inducible protein DinB